MPAGPECTGGIRGALHSLFPAAADPPARLTGSWRVLARVAEVAAVFLGAAVLLLRIPGVPAWDTVYAEDYSPFLIEALQHPWYLFVQYNGYEQLLPRAVAQLVTYLPLAYAAKAFACCGALTAAGCALFVAHASGGHIRSVPLRGLLAMAVVLLPIAPLEIADSTVDAPWYLLLALFWAMLWRPRTRTGMAVAAVVGFVTAASTSIVVVFAPLAVIRAIALRRPREHAVTAGWLAGCLVQLPVIAEALVLGQSRLAGEQNPGLGPDNWTGSLVFYLHDVVLRSIGWHISWWLESFTTEGWATLIAAGALAAVLGVIMVTQPGARALTVVAMATGFVFTVACLCLTPWAVIPPVTFHAEPESRYTALPVFLIEVVLVLGVDCALRRRRGWLAGLRPGQRPALPAWRPAAAVTALAVFLAFSWVIDFRYAGLRSAPSAHPWAPVVAEWQRDCKLSATGEISAKVLDGHQTIPCHHRRLLRAPPSDLSACPN